MASPPGTPEHPLRVAVVGSGPAGFYAAGHLLNAKDLTVEVDMGTGGTGCSHMWTCDLTADYVKINAEYRT